MESFEYLLDLAMAITDGQADADALREAYAALVDMDAERGQVSAVWHESCPPPRSPSPAREPTA